MIQGIERRKIFQDGKDRQSFLDQLTVFYWKVNKSRMSLPSHEWERLSTALSKLNL